MALGPQTRMDRRCTVVHAVPREQPSTPITWQGQSDANNITDDPHAPHNIPKSIVQSPQPPAPLITLSSVLAAWTVSPETTSITES
eukprot:1147521-Pelagomonas_calceolata.AAC.4